MPSGSGGGKFKHEVLTDMTHITIDGKSYYVDENYVGFKPDVYYAIVKYAQRTSSNQNRYNTQQTLGFVKDAEQPTQVRAVYFFSFNTSTGIYPTTNLYNNGPTTAFTFNYEDRKIGLFSITNGTLIEINSVEFWAWAE